MKKKNFVLAFTAVAVLSLTACGKEGGIIENNDNNITMPTVGSVTQYKETEAPTKAEPETNIVIEDWTEVELDGYSYRYSGKWSESKTEGVDSFIQYKDISDNQNIGMSSLAAGNYTLEEYAASMKKSYNEMVGYKVDKVEDRDFAGNKGKNIVINVVSGGVSMIVEQHFTIVDGILYCATYTRQKGVSDEAIKEASDVIDTVVINR